MADLHAWSRRPMPTPARKRFFFEEAGDGDEKNKSTGSSVMERIYFSSAVIVIVPIGVCKQIVAVSMLPV